MAGNHNSGRKTLPIDTHLDKGTHRADKHGAIPDGATGEPHPPKRLTGEARKWWERNVPDLVSRGLAKAIDSDALAQLAGLHALAEACRKLLKKAPADKDARIALTGYLGVYNAQARRFGLTFGDRQKLKIKPPPSGPAGVPTRQRG